MFSKIPLLIAVFAVPDTRHHTFYTMSEKRAAEGAPEVAEKKAKHAEDEEENVAEEEDIEEEENEEEGDDEEDVEGVRITHLMSVSWRKCSFFLSFGSHF